MPLTNDRTITEHYVTPDNEVTYLDVCDTHLDIYSENGQEPVIERTLTPDDPGRLCHRCLIVNQEYNQATYRASIKGDI